MKIKVTADSTCDLSQELLEKYDISVLPLYITKGEQSFKDGLEITSPDLFAYAEETGTLCGTAAVNVADYESYFENYLKEYDAIIHINISSDFSTCYQNAMIAAGSFENVYPIDSRNLSSGSGHLAIDAAVLSSTGMDAADIAEELKARAEKLDVSFVIDTLRYLHMGGRCSGIAALGANLLKLKPCIEVVNGRMTVGKKYRGSLDKVIAAYIKDRLEGRDDIDPRRVFITYSPLSDPSVYDAALDAVKKYGNFEEILHTTAGCTISNHCGPNCLGILFFRK